MSKEKGISQSRKGRYNISFVLLFFVIHFFTFSQNRKNDYYNKQEKIADSLFILCKENIKKGAYQEALFLTLGNYISHH